MNTLLNAAASAQASALLGRPTSIVVPFNTTSIWAGSRYFGMVAEYFEADLAIAITLCVLYASMAVSGGLILLDEYRGITGEEEKVEFEAENGSPTSAAGQPEMQTA